MKRGPVKYADALTSKYGEMKCLRCGELITCGLYTYREGYAFGRLLGYFDHLHKACSEENELWGIIAEEDAERKIAIEAELEASIAFRDRWDTCDLDEAIEDMQEALRELTVKGTLRGAL